MPAVAAGWSTSDSDRVVDPVEACLNASSGGGVVDLGAADHGVLLPGKVSMPAVAAGWSTCVMILSLHAIASSLNASSGGGVVDTQRAYRALLLRSQSQCQQWRRGGRLRAFHIADRRVVESQCQQWRRGGRLAGVGGVVEPMYVSMPAVAAGWSTCHHESPGGCLMEVSMPAVAAGWSTAPLGRP